MKCPHCSQLASIDDEDCPHCGVRLPTGRAEMGAESGCGIAAVYLLLIAIGVLLFGGMFFLRWIWVF